MNSLNIVHFNPDGIRGRQTNILNYIDQENTHVIAVSETHLKPGQHFSLGNFIPIRKDRTEKRKGGVAFFINNKIEFTVNDWFNRYQNLEALSVKISPSEVTRAPIDLVVYYNPPPKVIDKRLFEIVNRNSNNVVIIGDLNSPHTSFGKKFKSYSNSKLNPNLGKVTNLVMEDGNIAVTNKLKADTFAKSLGKIHQTYYDPNHDLNTETEARDFLNTHKEVYLPLEQAKQETEDDHYMLREINVIEITKTLKNCKNRSAPGEDQISYLILKNLDRDQLSHIALIYNSCLKTGYFPMAWKQAKVVMLPKPGKDLTKPTSYRPISLLPAIGKVFERIIANRLSTFLEKANYFDENQAGFRRNRSTLDQLFKLSQSVSMALKKHKKAVGVFLDVEKDFDTVWLDGLKYKLGTAEVGLPTKVTRLLGSFLTNRHLRVHQDSAISNRIELKAGTPQGSALSPLLFIIYVNDTQSPHQEYLLANLLMTWPPGPFRSKKREQKNLFKPTSMHYLTGVINGKSN